MRKLNHLLAVVLASTLLIGISLPASAAETPKIQGVPDGHWAESAVYDLFERDLLLGCWSAAGGPTIRYDYDLDRTFTRGLFFSAIIKFLFPNEHDQSGGWDADGAVMLEHGILHPGELDGGELDRSLRRQEAAVILSRVLQGLGIAPTALVDSSEIADWSDIYPGCREGVRIAWSAGLITASDATGGFNPHGTVDFAQEAVILDRLVKLVESRGVTGADWDAGRISAAGSLDGPPSMNQGVGLLPYEDWEFSRFARTLSHFKDMAQKYTYGYADLYQGKSISGEPEIEFTIQYGTAINDQGYDYDLEYKFFITCRGYDALQTDCGMSFGSLEEGVYEVEKEFYDVYLSEITTPTVRKNVWAMCDDLNERGVYYNKRWIQTYDNADDFDLWNRERLCYYYQVGDGVVMCFDTYTFSLWTEEYAAKNEFQVLPMDQFPWFNTANKPA